MDKDVGCARKRAHTQMAGEYEGALDEADVTVAHIGSRIARACGHCMDAREIMRLWECSEEQARQSYTFGTCDAVYTEVEEGLSHFVERATGLHALEWHFELTPRLACSKTVDSVTSAHDACALADISILCRGDATSPDKGLRAHVCGVALVLDGHVIDMAAHVANQSDPRVLEFPRFTTKCPLITEWLHPDASLRVVVYLSSLPPSFITPTQHVRIIADAMFFDVRALERDLTSSETLVWSLSPNPVMACVMPTTTEDAPRLTLMATGELDEEPAYKSLASPSTLDEDDARSYAYDALSAGGSDVVAPDTFDLPDADMDTSDLPDSDDDDEYLIPKNWAEMCARAGVSPTTLPDADALTSRDAHAQIDLCEQAAAMRVADAFHEQATSATAALRAVPLHGLSHVVPDNLSRVASRPDTPAMVAEAACVARGIQCRGAMDVRDSGAMDVRDRAGDEWTFDDFTSPATREASRLLALKAARERARAQAQSTMNENPVIHSLIERTRAQRKRIGADGTMYEQLHGGQHQTKLSFTPSHAAAQHVDPFLPRIAHDNNEHELETYAREHLETMALMDALADTSIEAYARLVHERNAMRMKLQGDARDSTYEWQRLQTRITELTPAAPAAAVGEA